MRTLTLTAVMGIAIAIACTVDRPSEALACSGDTDCAGFADRRACVEGYCLVQNCPADCASCNETARTCQIDCTSQAGCNNVTCATGWSCTINCTGDGACNDVGCNGGSQCTVACGGAGACHNINCAKDSHCDVTCMSDGACNEVRCKDACSCDVTSPGAASSSIECPTVGNGGNQVRCTVDGNTGTECDSARDSRCVSC